MLAATVLPLPQGTPPFQPDIKSGTISVINVVQEDATTIPVSNEDSFQFKARECKSAPVPHTRTLEDFGESDDEESSESSESSTNPKKSSARTFFSKEISRKNVKRKTCCHCSCSLFSDFFVGNASSFTTWSTSYASKSRLRYLIMFFLEASLRSIGEVTFCSNPFSGLLIFTGMLIACPLVAFLAFLTLTMGIETAVVFLHVPMEEIRSGVVTFNNFLTGTVIAMIAQQDVILVQPEIIGVCLAIGVLTVIFWRGLNGSLAARFEFPLLNAPFHVMILLYIYTGVASKFKTPVTMESHTDSIFEAQGLRSYYDGSPLHSNDSITVIETTTIRQTFVPLDIDPSEKYVESLDWRRIFFGVILAPSQVFGTSSVLTSSLVHAGMFLYSPIMLLESLTGSAIGTLIGVALTYPEDYESLYNGSWGYNPLLTTAAIGGFFVAFNFHCWLLSLAGAILTTLVYAAMLKCQVAPLGIPFMVTTWLVLPSIPIRQNNTSSNSSSTGANNAVQIVSEDIERAFTKQTTSCEVIDQIASEGMKQHFQRINLCDITYPEDHRRKFCNPKQSKTCKKEYAKNTKRSNEKKFLSKRESNSRIDSTGVQNKYSSSIPDTPPKQDDIPPELLTGVEEHSILPL